MGTEPIWPLLCTLLALHHYCRRDAQVQNFFVVVPKMLISFSAIRSSTPTIVRHKYRTVTVQFDKHDHSIGPRRYSFYPSVVTCRLLLYIKVSTLQETKNRFTNCTQCIICFDCLTNLVQNAMLFQILGGNCLLHLIQWKWGPFV